MAEIMPLSGPQEIQLSKPLEVIDKTVTKLTMREPTGEDLRLCGGNGREGTDFTFFLAARLTGIPRQCLDKLSARDATKLTRTIQGFLTEEDQPISSTSTSS